MTTTAACFLGEFHTAQMSQRSGGGGVILDALKGPGTNPPRREQIATTSKNVDTVIRRRETGVWTTENQQQTRDPANVLERRRLAGGLGGCGGRESTQ